MKVRAWQAIAWLVVVAVAPLAYGGEDDIAAARTHYRNGTRAYDLGHYVEAAAEYEAAYRAKDDPALLFNLGQAYRAAGDKVNAIRVYKSFLRRQPDSQRRDEVERRILELQKALDVESAEKPAPVIEKPAPAIVKPAPAIEKPAPISAPAAATPATTNPQTTAAANYVTASRAHRSTPVYKRWWLWTVVSVVAVGAAVGLGIGLTQSTFPSTQTNGGTFRF
jgi:tetratricopeptide (TPR) repeat protein